MKSQLINSMLSFTLGTGASLLGLAMWTGTTDLEEIKQSVQFYVAESENHADALLAEYNVTVDNANAEIGEYKEALAEANGNISKLIITYESKVEEMEQALADMQTRLDQQYETDMNVIIDQANAEINKANQEVSDTRVEVAMAIEGSQVDEIVNSEKSVLDTTGDKTVTDISSIVGEVEGE